MSKSSHKSSLFLLELILSLFFFSLASAVCIQLFAKAHVTEKETEELNHAVPLAESAAEAYHSVLGDLDRLAVLLPDGHLNSAGDSFQIFYSKDWKPLGPFDEETPEYTMSLTPDPENQAGNSSLLIASVRITSGTRSIYELTASAQLSRTVPGL